MESKLARHSEQELIAATQRLTAEERLNVFLMHCQLVTELYLVGRGISKRHSSLLDSQRR